MSGPDEFQRMMDTESIDLINHNETDFQKFREFQKSLDAQYRATEAARRSEERRANLKAWDAKMTGPWRNAKLNTLRDQTAVASVETLLTGSLRQNMFIRGGEGTGKTYLALAVIRRLIGHGIVTPSRIYHTSEAMFLNVARSGFRYNEVLSEVLAPKHTLYLLDDVGHKSTYTEQEQILWTQLLDHISKNDLLVLFTSQKSARAFSDSLPSTAQAKFSYLITENVITMTGKVTPTQINDGMTEIEQEEASNDDLFNGRVSKFRE